MNKKGKNKLMPLMVLMILLVSVFTIIPQSLVADPYVFPDGTNGSAFGLTPGQTITYRVTNNSLNESEDYSIWVNGAKWIELGDDESTSDGDIVIEFKCPGWNELGQDPIGTWTLDLHDEDNTSLGANYQYDITIANYHHLKFKYDGDFVDYLIYNQTYTPFYIYVYNWTGSKYELQDDVDLDITLYDPDVDVIASQTGIDTGIWDLDLTNDDLNYNNGVGNLEYYLMVNVSENSYYTNLSLPIRLDVTANLPEDATWGDDITVTGYVYDGQGDGVPDYTMRLYSPVNGGYYNVYETDTYSTGRYTLSTSTGPDVDAASAGTWYVGTYTTGTGRINDADMYEDPIDDPNFIQYYSFEVASDSSARVNVEDPDEIVSGFVQTLNISVYNDSDWEDAFDNMWIHVTGLEANYSGTLYEDDDIITLGNYANNGTSLSSNEKYAYYEFDIKFEETGTGTIIVTYPNNNSIYSDDEYNNTDLEANITGTTTFSVVSPDDMNIIVTGMPEAVNVDDSDACAWINQSTTITINIYGDDEDTPMNATITIKGAGVDIKIDEDDGVGDVDELVAKGNGMYQVRISPKYAGTITISVDNDTENMTGSKDYAIKGLSGSVTTSIGDDLEISVESTEMITVNIVNGQYGEVHLTYYDENWNELACLNDTVGENEAGNGLNGEFEFTVLDEDIEDGVGYIVVAARCGGDFYLYDVIEVAPIHDLMFEVLDPEEALNQTLTVGLEHEWEFKVTDENGNVIEDIDEVTGEILDEDDDVLQEVSLEEKSGSVWYMDEFIPFYAGSLVLTAVNNSGENEHDGNITFDVGLATFTFSPASTTAGIGIENLTVEVTGVDANDNPIPDGTELYLNIDNADDTVSDPDDGETLTLDEDGMGEFEIEEVGDVKGKINFTFNQAYDASDEQGNVSNGQFDILYPVFVVDPPEIYIGQSNQVTITAYDQNNEPIEGINITLIPSTIGIIGSQPDPVETDATGQAVLSVSPVASGKLNVTIARDLEYIGGQLNWTNSVITDTVITVTSLKTLTVELSKSPIFQGETLTVTVKSGTNMVSGATVKFGQESKTTGSNGEATFTVPDPGVESAVYKVTASKTGYTSTTEDLTVIKKYAITIVGPTGDITTGQQVTVTVLAKGSALAGATITFEGNTYTSNENGKVTFTMPDTEGTYTVTATYEEYTDGTLTITISPGGVPGFEVLTLLAAIGVAFILLRRRQH